MKNVTGNVMTIEHIQDFYYLEALRSNLMMAKSSHPEFHFRRAVEKLENDIDEAFNTLSERMALHIWIYLWGACLGEAEYAGSMCEYTIPELRNFGYTQTFNYFPTEENIQKVIDVYDQEWSSSGYGGKAWKQITEAVALYGKIPHAAFIDHTVDLEHNGGCVFNKTGKEPFHLDCNGSYDGGDLHNFLDAKFAKDILNETPRYVHYVNVSRKVYDLIVRYSNVITPVKAVEFAMPRLEWLSQITVEWNDGAFENTFGWVESEENERNRCAGCGDHACDNCGTYVYGRIYCSSCVTKCELCDRYVTNGDTTYIDGEDATWCDNCAQSHMDTCQECGHDYHTDNFTCTTDDECLCNDCAQSYECKYCDEVHYTDMDEHMTTHEEEILEDKQSEARKREGVAQLPLFNPIGYEISYAWTQYGETHSCNVTGEDALLDQIATFKLAGAQVITYKKVKS